jgi:hypothetical protein
MDPPDERTTMSASMDNTNPPTETPIELAHRTGDGLDVLLLWNRGDDQLKVVVDDLRTGSSFEFVAGDGRQGLDAFYHPFAYAARGVTHRSQAPEGELVVPETTAPASSER